MSEFWDSCHKCGVGDWWRRVDTVQCDRCGYWWNDAGESGSGSDMVSVWPATPGSATHVISHEITPADTLHPDDWRLSNGSGRSARIP